MVETEHKARPLGGLASYKHLLSNLKLTEKASDRLFRSLTEFRRGEPENTELGQGGLR
jgi:hypothetical protein